MKKFIPFFFLIIIMCCKKEKSEAPTADDTIATVDSIPQKYDTLKSGDYFPAYSKSIWYYLNDKGDTIIHKTDSAYTLTNLVIMGIPMFYKPKYLIQYDGMFVNGYNLLINASWGHDDNWRDLLPNPIYKGASFQIELYFPYSTERGIILAVDTTLTIQSVKYDSVVVVDNYLYASAALHPYGRTYYAKHIGIIKQEEWAVDTDSIISQELLVRYKIGKK